MFSSYLQKLDGAQRRIGQKMQKKSLSLHIKRIGSEQLESLHIKQWEEFQNKKLPKAPFPCFGPAEQVRIYGKTKTQRKINTSLFMKLLILKNYKLV